MTRRIGGQDERVNDVGQQSSPGRAGRDAPEAHNSQRLRPAWSEGFTTEAVHAPSFRYGPCPHVSRQPRVTRVAAPCRVLRRFAPRHRQSSRHSLCGCQSLWTPIPPQAHQPLQAGQSPSERSDDGHILSQQNSRRRVNLRLHLSNPIRRSSQVLGYSQGASMKSHEGRLPEPHHGIIL